MPSQPRLDEIDIDEVDDLALAKSEVMQENIVDGAIAGPRFGHSFSVGFGTLNAAQAINPPGAIVSTLAVGSLVGGIAAVAWREL